MFKKSNFLTLLQKMNVRTKSFFIPTLLAVGSACLEGASFGLMVPLLRGMIERNYDFLQTHFVFEKIAQFLGRPTLHGSEILILMLVAIFMSAGIKNVFDYVSSCLMEVRLAEFGHTLRQRLFLSYLKAGKVFFDQHNFGHLNQILLGFVNELMLRLQHIRQTLLQIFMLIIYLVMMVRISWQITLLCLTMMPLLQVILKWLIQKIEQISNWDAQTKIQMQEKISNLLFCIPLVKAYGRESSEFEAISKKSKELEAIQMNMNRKWSLVTPFQEMFILTASLILMGAMAWRVVSESENQMANFFIFFILVRRAMTAFTSIYAIQAVFGAVEGASKEVLNILDASQSSELIFGNIPFSGLKSEIEIQKLNFSYDAHRQVLKDVSMLIPKGKVTALVGATGSGKTTLVNLLMRFYAVPKKTIFVDGQDICEFEKNSYLSHIAYVHQDAQIFNETLSYNLLYGIDRRVSDQEIQKVLTQARLDEFIKSLPKGLETATGDRGILLSGGEKQRLALARALLKKSQIMILDEATSALDSMTEQKVQAAIDEAIKDKTVIIIAHRLATIQKADQVIVLEKGRIVETGNWKELLDRKEKLYEYWQQQNIQGKI